MAEIDDPARAVALLLQVDPTFVDEPARLRRGLLDLLPDNDRAVHLITVGAETGVPALISAGDPTSARQRLIDAAGLRDDVADWVVAVWAAGTAAEGPAAPPAANTAVPEQELGTPTAVRIAAWPDGVLLVVAMGATGFFAASIDPTQAVATAPNWHRVASPQAALSRDAAVIVHGEEATVVWSDADGVFASAVRRPGTRLAIEPARRIVPAHGDDQPRYPLAALPADQDSIDVFWTADRQRLWRSTLRPWSTDAAPLELPAFCQPGERARRLDAALVGTDAAWLVALTDRHRLLVSRWSLTRDDLASWVALPHATTILDVAIGGPAVYAWTGKGSLR
jgi:hypothetical protein